MGSLVGIAKVEAPPEIVAETRAFFTALLERFHTTDEKLREDATALARKEEQENKKIEECVLAPPLPKCCTQDVKERN